ncbi:hypothetical protein GCM10008090_09220 [Arenicella chitinivorans]|uniref:DUF2330 domain-containing protein n=1 Tax=Arenicella chitinivorans TaxID=1329800 RepID=A0A918VJX2_9GAMM|nr:hypothetical protein [Arenicella chitinivorans]GHA02111.1 hypothetical protein GCM10008090_09220 [Arenicella chitinivorans]
MTRLPRCLTRGLIATSLAIHAVFGATHALSLPETEIHDFIREGSVLRVTGPDPYITFTPFEADQNGHFLLLNLRLEDLPPNLNSVPLELFFSANSPGPQTQSDKMEFDPRYRIRMHVPRSEFTQPATWLVVPLPDKRPPSSKFRLDFERCNTCSVAVLSHPKVVHSTPTDNPSVQPTRIYNGVTKVPDDGLALPLTNWQLHDMDGDINGLSVTGLDPFVTSPVIDLSTENLGGITVTLSRTQPAASDYLDFQLFYATERHGFRADASTMVRIKADVSEQYNLVIPLRFLSEEQPADHIIERVRLDFLPEASNNHWRIQNVKAISKTQLAQFKSSPATTKIQTNKQQRAGKRQLLINVLRKITADWPFTLFYLVLLITTGIAFWRRFKV